MMYIINVLRGEKIHTELSTLCNAILFNRYPYENIVNVGII